MQELHVACSGLQQHWSVNPKWWHTPPRVLMSKGTGQSIDSLPQKAAGRALSTFHIPVCLVMDLHARETAHRGPNVLHWLETRQMSDMANKITSLDAAVLLLLHLERHGRAATDFWR